MTDVLSKKQRSRCMAAIGGSDTSPELAVRSLVHALGFRFRLHDCSLPGRPDMILRSHQSVILVHGCFWHSHHCALGRPIPKTNSEFWRVKRRATVSRDRTNARRLRRGGWRILTVWECELRDFDRLTNKILRFFYNVSA
ncbi:MAG: DNA mismatch endonuclease Vsr [Candidatus Zixiibacteriota bacterium]